MPQPHSTALPFATALLRILIVLNWLMAAAILTLLLVIPHEEWILKSMDLTPSPEATRVIWSLRVIAVAGLVALPVNHLVLTRLLAMVATARAGDPFVAANALRLRAIGWSLVALQLIGLLIGVIARFASTPEHPININSEWSLNGWLAVLLTFVLARVFAEGATMRDDLDGTV